MFGNEIEVYILINEHETQSDQKRRLITRRHVYTFGQWYSKIDLVYLLRGVNSFENEKWIQEIMFKMAHLL